VARNPFLVARKYFLPQEITQARAYTFLGTKKRNLWPQWVHFLGHKGLLAIVTSTCTWYKCLGMGLGLGLWVPK
jgi:hypothetical protein